VSGVLRAGTRLRSRYANLAPDERFRAVLEAAARDDFDERESLVATCPEKTYRMPDATFLELIEASRDLAFAVAVELGPRLAEARGLDAVRRVLLAVEDAAARFDEDQGHAVRRPPAWAFLKEVDRCSSKLRSQAAAVFEGFAAVCRDQIGLEPQTVLRAHLGDLQVATLGLQQLDGAKPDRAALRDWRELFVRKWRERVE
jgi:hypothetical protein